MTKLIIKFSNSLSPLDQPVLKIPLIKEISVEDINDLENILKQAETLLMGIDGYEKVPVIMEITKENGGIVFSGCAQNGSLSGVKAS
jgi:hypothetical protein